MRQRSVKNRDAIAADCSAWIADDPKAKRGSWRSAFADPSLPLHLEIGSGKGRFICEMARLHPDVNFIAVEGGKKINVRILQKAKDYNLSNLLVIMDYIVDARDFFAEGELDRIYLNFSDPWPKARNAKRRLTYREKLKAYEACAAPGAVLQFKTDNEELFDYSLMKAEAKVLKESPETRDRYANATAGAREWFCFSRWMSQYPEKVYDPKVLRYRTMLAAWLTAREWCYVLDFEHERPTVSFIIEQLHKAIERENTDACRRYACYIDNSNTYVLINIHRISYIWKEALA